MARKRVVGSGRLNRQEAIVIKKNITDIIVELCKVDNTTTGKVFVMKQGEGPFEGFHY